MKNGTTEDMMRILNSLEDGFLRTNTKGKIIVANQAIAQMCGYSSSEEMIGLHMNTLFVNPEEREQMVNELKENDKQVNFELELKRKNGTTFWSLSTIKSYYDENGNQLGTEAVIHDYTGIRQIKEKLEHENKTLEAIYSVNQLITKEKKIPELLESICHILTEKKGYYSAWIVLLDEEGRFNAVYESGLDKEFQNWKNQLKKNKLPECALKALKLKKVISIANVAEECLNCPLAKPDQDRGALTGPVIYKNKLYGFTTVSIPQKHLVKKEVELFKNVIDDIGLALHNIESEKKRLNAEKELKTANLKLNAANQQLQASERQLKANQEILMQTQKIANVGSWEWDVETDKVTWSEEQFRIFRLNPEKGAPSYADHLKIFTPESIKRLDDAVKKCLKNGTPYEIDLEIIRGDKTKAFCTARGHAGKDNKGKVTRLFGSFQDITERKKNEEERRKINERFRIAQEMSPDGFTILRPVRDEQNKVIDFIWVYENEAVARMNGTDPQKVVGQRLLELFPGHQGTQFFKAYKEAAEKGKSITFEDKYVGESIKKPTWFRIVVVPMGEDIAILNNDITKRKLAEQNLKNTINLSPSIIAKANLETGYYIEANQAVTNILGYSIEEFTSRPIKEFIHPDDNDNTQKTISEQLEGNEVLQFENRFLCKNGSYKWISWNATKANDDWLVLGIGSDVTERKKAEEKLKESEASLRDAQRIANFGNWSLDLKTGEVKMSEEMLNLFGLKDKNEASDLSNHEKFYTPESWHRIIEAIEEARTTGKNYEIELEFSDLIVKFRYAIARGEPMYNESNQIIGVKGTLQDITERKKIITSLKESEDFLNRTGEIARVGGWQLADNFTRVVWTKTTGDIHELPEGFHPSLEEAINYYHPDDRDKIRKCVTEAIEKGKPYNIKIRLKTAKGNLRWVRAIGSPETNNGKCVRLSGTFQDVTEQTKTENRLKESEEKLKAVINNSPFPIAVADEKDQSIQFWSKSAHQLFGHNPKTTEEWYKLAYPDPEYRQEVINQWTPYLEKARNSNKAFNTGEYKIHCKNGTVKICELYAQFLPGSLIVTFNDITKQKKAQKKIHFQANLLNVVEQSVIVTEPDGKIIYWNPFAEKLYGWSLEEVLGKDIMKINIPQISKKQAAEIMENLSSGKSWSGEFLVQHRDGRSFPIFVTNSPIYDSEDKLTGIIGISYDITERKQAEEKLKAAKEKLTQHHAELEKRVKERTSDLQQKIEEIERLNKLFVGREFRIKELKTKLKEMEESLKEK